MNKSLLWHHLGIADEISLIQQLYETYGEETDTGIIVHINNQPSDNYVRITPDVCGFRNEKTIEKFDKQCIFTPFDKEDYPHHNQSLDTKFYKATINWKLLEKYAELLHDREADQPYGQFKQKQALKDALLRKVDKIGRKEIVVTEKILGMFPDHVSAAQYIRGQESPDRYISFMRTLRLLEKEKFLEVQNVQFQFDASSTPVEEEIARLEGGVFVDEDVYFYPAEHCMVKLLIKELAPTEQDIQPVLFTPKSVLPVKPSAEKIFKSFSPQNYSFVLTVIRSILLLTDFSHDGKVNYKLQSPPGQLIINERSLLDKLNVEGLFSHYEEEGIGGIITLGNINTDVLREIESYLTKATGQTTATSKNPIPDTADRRGLERKWDTLQAIWTVYEASSRPESIFVPVAAVVIKGRMPEEIDGIIEGLKNKGGFAKWGRKDRYYIIENINHDRFPLIYQQIKASYEKPVDNDSKVHSQRKNHILQWDGLKLDTDSGRGECNGIIHIFKLAKPHFKVLEVLLKANGNPVTYNQFFEVVDKELKNNEKTGKEYIRQKIRDIRKHFHLNRRKNRDADIFYDTGNGFKLMLLKTPA